MEAVASCKEDVEKTITKCKEQETISEISVRSSTHLPQRGGFMRSGVYSVVVSVLLSTSLRLRLQPIILSFEQMSSYTRRWSARVQQEASKAEEKTPECTEGSWSQRVLSTIGKLGPKS